MQDLKDGGVRVTLQPNARVRRPLRASRMGTVGAYWGAIGGHWRLLGVWGWRGLLYGGPLSTLSLIWIRPVHPPRFIERSSQTQGYNPTGTTQQLSCNLAAAKGKVNDHMRQGELLPSIYLPASLGYLVVGSTVAK